MQVFVCKISFSKINNKSCTLINTILTVQAGQSTLTVGAEIEPSFVCLGPYHLALGMNNRVWYYELGDMSVDFVRDREYLGTVQDIHLNGDYVAVLFDGKVQLHVLEGEGVGGGGGVDGGGADGQGRRAAFSSITFGSEKRRGFCAQAEKFTCG